MKCTIPEISWHNRDPVLSIDVQINNESGFYRLASGGTDSHVLIWKVLLADDGSIKLECVSDLTRHQKAVNVVRFSPCGTYLASGDDESTIIVWRQKTDQDRDNPCDDDDKAPEVNLEQWIQMKVLRGHLNDVYDISWSPDSIYLMSGSVDNTAIVWDVQKGKKLKIFDDHQNFVQGVTWDPKNQFLASLSSDSKCRVFCSKTYKLLNRISKGKLPGCKDPELKSGRLFHDDTLKTFFRRLTFTPDGSLLIAPSGYIECSELSQKHRNAAWVFLRKQFNKPVMYYPTLGQPCYVVKCCPVLFELKPNSQNQKNVTNLPYRIVIAVATKSSILLYDTQHAVPIAIISNIHYTKLTDISWSSDGRLLVASSTDGYCSLITFAPNELGTPYQPPAQDEQSQKPELMSID